MSVALWMLLGYCLALFTGGLIWKEVRDYQIRRKRPPSAPIGNSKVEKSDSTEPPIFAHAGRG
jgi:hypothetical protein